MRKRFFIKLIIFIVIVIILAAFSYKTIISYDVNGLEFKKLQFLIPTILSAALVFFGFVSLYNQDELYHNQNKPIFYIDFKISDKKDEKFRSLKRFSCGLFMWHKGIEESYNSTIKKLSNSNIDDASFESEIRKVIFSDYGFTELQIKLDNLSEISAYNYDVELKCKNYKFVLGSKHGTEKIDVKNKEQLLKKYKSFLENSCSTRKVNPIIFEDYEDNTCKTLETHRFDLSFKLSKINEIMEILLPKRHILIKEQGILIPLIILMNPKDSDESKLNTKKSKLISFIKRDNDKIHIKLIIKYKSKTGRKEKEIYNLNIPKTAQTHKYIKVEKS